MPAFAGGPLEVRNGKALSYGRRPIIYRYDQEGLGILKNEEAIKLVEELFSKWEEAQTASIEFKQDKLGFIEVDINAANFQKFLKPKTEADLNGFTPIVFDEDGSLLDALFGEGGGNAALGIGGPVVLTKGSSHKIVESQIVLNGRFLNGVDNSSDKEVDIDTFKRTILHEIGHAIGLDHSQINVEAIGLGVTKDIKDSVPLMFPRAVSGLFVLRRDDISAISLLYPNKIALNSLGVIEGKILRADGKTPILGANVIARNVDNPNLEAISCVSDFLKRKNGEYKLFALPPGNYTLEIEPISPEFVGGSMGFVGPRVGPYTNSLNDKSFTDPVPKGYFTGSNLPVTGDLNKAKIIQVIPGDVMNDINIIGTLKNETDEASIKLEGKNNIQLTSDGNKTKITVIGTGFESSSNCKVVHTTDLKLNIRPASFVLSPAVSVKSFVIQLPNETLKDLISKGVGSQDIDVSVNCSNGATQTINIEFIIQ